MVEGRVNRDVDVDVCSLDELRALVREQQQVIARLERDLRAARTQINRLQDQTQRHPTKRLDQEYSVEAEEKRKLCVCRPAGVRRDSVTTSGKSGGRQSI